MASAAITYEGYVTRIALLWVAETPKAVIGFKTLPALSVLPACGIH